MAVGKTGKVPAGRVAEGAGKKCGGGGEAAAAQPVGKRHDEVSAGVGHALSSGRPGPPGAAQHVPAVSPEAGGGGGAWWWQRGRVGAEEVQAAGAKKTEDGGEDAGRSGEAHRGVSEGLEAAATAATTAAAAAAAAAVGSDLRLRGRELPQGLEQTGAGARLLAAGGRVGGGSGGGGDADGEGGGRGCGKLGSGVSRQHAELFAVDGEVSGVACRVSGVGCRVSGVGCVLEGWGLAVCEQLFGV